MILIRKFDSSDFSQMMEVEKECFDEGNPWLYTTLYETHADGFLVAEEDGVIIGYMVIVLTEQGEGRVFSVAVKKDYRKMNVATHLLNAAFSLLRQKGINGITLEVREGNKPAQKLYRKLGFTPVRVIPEYYTNGENAIVMRKDLTDKEHT